MKHLIFITVSVIFLTGCSPRSKGYTDVKELYKASMKALQSNNENKIRQFVQNVLPDAGTIRVMKKKGISYRGVPDYLKDHPDAMKEWEDEFTADMVHLAQKLERRGILQKLQFIGFDEELAPEQDEPGSGVMITEPFGRFGCATDTIEYKIGELLRINGKWKTFTEAKL